MMEVVVITEAIRRAKLQSNCHYQQTISQLLEAGTVNYTVIKASI